MDGYLHRVHYYETDKMGVTHHSNYIRWMEEARVDFLDRIGCSYAALEQRGVVSPVVGLDCRFLRATTFDDVIRVRVRVKELGSVRLVIAYEMTDEDTGAVVFTGTSTHCFLDREGKPIVLKKRFPDVDLALRTQTEPAGETEGGEQRQ